MGFSTYDETHKKKIRIFSKTYRWYVYRNSMFKKNWVFLLPRSSGDRKFSFAYTFFLSARPFLARPSPETVTRFSHTLYYSQSNVEAEWMLSGWMFFLCFDPVLTRVFFSLFFCECRRSSKSGVVLLFSGKYSVFIGGCFFKGKKLLPLRTTFSRPLR